MTGRRSVDGLAFLGGEPAFAQVLHVGRPNIGDRQRLHDRIDRALDARWLSNQGALVQEFERRICELLDVRHAVATCNATVGLQVAASTLGLTGEVIVPSFTFVATAHAMRWLGLTPVFCDVDPRTHNLDPRRVEELIGPRTSAILGVHLWGRACAVDDLTDIAGRYGLRLLFDAAHAFGCTHRGRPLGGFGDAEILSFHATKFVNAFEGGAITTDDDDLAAALRLRHNFGFAHLDEVAALGTNAKMSEAAAAMGLTSLEAMDGFLAANRRNHDAYRDALGGIDGLTVVEPDPAERSNHQYVVVEVDEDVCGVARDVLVAVLQAENVFARRYFHPGVHRMEPYRTDDPTASRRLPATEALAGRVLVLPTGTAVSPEDIELIGDLVRFAVKQADLLPGPSRQLIEETVPWT